MLRGAHLIGLATAMFLLAGQGHAAMTEAEVKQSVEQTYNVRVLGIKRIEHGGGPAFRVTFMNPGGDFNTAYQVSSIVIDVETGQLIARFRHRSSGYDPNAAPQFLTDRQVTNALESGLVWR